MLTPIRFESTIHLKDIPIQWISRIELYYPDLMGFPIVYVHSKKDGVRLYGFAASISYTMKNSGRCDAEVLFLSNVNPESEKWARGAITNELMERFGISGRFGKAEIMSACNGNKSYEHFFSELWNHVSKVAGDSIPYGRFFEEIYSIVRFVSAWQPKTGRQSEMRMLYNFLSIFGRKIDVTGKWNFVEFYLLPTYDDVLDTSFNEFSEFETLFKAMQKSWKKYFSREATFEDTKIRSMNNAWPQNKSDFITKISVPLEESGLVNHQERHSLERLVDAFNRHPWRAAFFIWSIMTIGSKDYRSWDKNFFVKFYLSKSTGAGISEKVLACFLQQGFGKEEIIPIDTWVQSFYEMALGIRSKEEFLSSFSKMGKLERLIWLASQGRKTNMGAFFNMLWCVRFGVTGNRELRGPNPISCYECDLKASCPSYERMIHKSVLIRELDRTSKNVSDTYIQNAERNNCSYICLTDNGVPKMIYEKRGKTWKLTDEFSGYLLKSHHKTDVKNRHLKVQELFESLPPFIPDENLKLVED